MSALIFPRRFEQQPQEAVELNRENYFAARLIAGTHGGAQFTNVANGRVLTRTAGVSQGPGRLSFNGTAGNRVEYGAAGSASAFTIVAQIRPSVDTVNHPIFDNKAVSEWTTNKGFTFLLRESSAGRGFQFHVGTGLTYSNSGVYFAPGASYYVEAVFKPGTNQDVFIDGVEAAYTSRTVASSFVASPNTLKTGTYYDATSVRSANAGIEFAYLFDGAFSAAERNALRENPWQLFRRPPLRIFTGGAASGLDLAIQSATHSHAADNLSLSATLALSVADAAHAHSSDSAAVTANYALTVNDAAHAHSADNVDVVAGAAIVVADSSHAHTAESPAPSIGAGLAVADAIHAQSADSAAVTAAYALAVSDSSHAHSADNVVVDTGGSLTIQSATHAHTAEQITLTAALGLAIDSATHGHFSETLTLGAVLALVIDSADHGHAAENLTLDTAITLAIADALHGHLSDGMTLTIGATLAIADALHAHAADGLTLSASLVLAVNDALHGHSADNLTMTVSGAGVSLSAEDIAAIAEAVWSHPKALTFQRFIATKDL